MILLEKFRIVFIRTQHSGESVNEEVIADSQTALLQVMRKAGLPVRKACRNGGCGVCRCLLVRGEVDYRQRAPFALWEKDIAEGWILPCIAFAKTELVLDRLSLDAKGLIF